MITFESKERDIKYIRPVLLKYKKNNGDAMKAMCYLERLCNEYKLIGITKVQWDFIEETYNDLIGMKKRKYDNENTDNKKIIDNNKSTNDYYFADDENEKNIDIINKTVNKLDINYCNVCDNIIQFSTIHTKKRKRRKKKDKKESKKKGKPIDEPLVPSEGEQIRRHYASHGNNMKTDHQCRICWIKFANQTVLKGHYHSQHRDKLVATKLLPESVNCNVCKKRRQSSYDGRAGYWKIYCVHCPSKLKPKPGVETAILQANIYNDKQLAEKYPLPHENQMNEIDIDNDNDSHPKNNIIKYPSSTGYTINEDTAAEVVDWLKSFGLTCYYKNFVNNAFDSMEMIKQITKESILQDMGIQMIAHQLLLMNEIKKLH
eukprot:194333_1